ncbi:MAG: YIP1 family protein [Terriglobia bacterium]
MGADLSNPVQGAKRSGRSGLSWRRLWGVIFDPVATFASLARQPDFGAPLLLLIGVAVAVTEVMLRRIGLAEIVRRNLQLSGRASRMTPQQMQQAISQGVRMGAVAVHFRAPLGVFFSLLIMTVIGAAILKAGCGSRVGFKTAFSVAAYADLPAALAGLLSLVVLVMGDPARLNPGNVNPANIGFYLSPLSLSRPVYVLAASADFSTLWFLGLFSIGLASTTKGRARPRGIFLCLLVLWAAWVAVKVGLAAL